MRITGVVGRALREGLEDVEPARALHAHVGHHEIVAARDGALDRARAVVDGVDLVALAAQDLAQQIARDAIVLGDEDACHALPPRDAGITHTPLSITRGPPTRRAPAALRRRLGPEPGAPAGAPSRGSRT